MSDNDLTQTHQHVTIIVRLLMTDVFLTEERLQSLLHEYSRMDALMPFVDPTGYRAVMGNIPGHRRVAQAVLGLRQTVAAELNESELGRVLLSALE